MIDSYYGKIFDRVLDEIMETVDDSLSVSVDDLATHHIFFGFFVHDSIADELMDFMLGERGT